MQWFKEADGGNPDGTAKDRVGLTAGTTYLAKYWNDNFFNIFNFVTGQGYSLIDDNLEQFVKASKGKYNPAYTYNTSSIATQTVNDVVLGSDGIYYEAQANAVVGEDPVGSITGNWAVFPLDLNAATVSYVDTKPTGQKNLLINGRKLIQQRVVTGGRKQVVLNTANLGGAHTISFTGTATVTIKEASTLAASDALTTWDTALVTEATSGTTVTLTSGKYIHVEYSTTDFDDAMLEYGSIATNYPVLEDTIDKCLPYYEKSYDISVAPGTATTGGAFRGIANQGNDFYFSGVVFKVEKRTIPALLFWGGTSGTANVFYNESTAGNIGAPANLATSTKIISIYDPSVSLTVGQRYNCQWTANAEIFNADDGVGINYKEDRWYV